MAYKIKIGGVLAYDQRKAFKNFHVLDPVWTRELRKADKLTFTLPRNNYAYNMPGILKRDVVLYDDDAIVFRGRVLKVKRTMYGDKQVTCEGDLGFLNDSVLPPFTFEGYDLDFCRYVLNAHNAQVNADRRIEADRFGEAHGTAWLKVKTEDFGSCFDALMSNWRHEVSGEAMSCWLETKWTEDNGTITSHLSFTAQAGDSLAEPAALGKNLLDLSELTSGEDIYTVIVPLGADHDTGQVDEDGEPVRFPLTIVSAQTVPTGFTHSGRQLENDAAVAALGRIARAVRFSDIDEDDYETLAEAADALLARGAEELTAHIAASLTMEASAVDLKKAGFDSRGFHLGYLTRVKHPLLGVNESFVCNRTEERLASPEKSKYRFGDARTAMTEALNATARSATAAQRAAETAQNTAVNAQSAANAAGESIAGGYDPEEGYSAGDLVMHNHKLYEARQDIPSGEEWTPEHWKEITLSGLVTENQEKTLAYKRMLTSADDLRATGDATITRGHYGWIAGNVPQNSPTTDAASMLCLQNPGGRVEIVYTATDLYWSKYSNGSWGAWVHTADTGGDISSLEARVTALENAPGTSAADIYGGKDATDNRPAAFTCWNPEAGSGPGDMPGNCYTYARASELSGFDNAGFSLSSGRYYYVLCLVGQADQTNLNRMYMIYGAYEPMVWIGRTTDGGTTVVWSQIL